MSSPQRVDLHTHTYYSDGRPSPEEIVNQAAHLGLSAIAITDHDNTHGFREAVAPAKQVGIELIPGIELTTCWDSCPALLEKADIDLLGYFIDLDDPAFQAVEEAALADIHARVDECCQQLTAAGYPVTLADVFSENPHYAGILQLIQFFNHKGYLSNRESTDQLILGNWQTIRPGKLTIADAITAIHHAGGKAVLAHPILVKTVHGWLWSDEMAELVKMGLDGIEIYHHRLNQKAREHFLRLAHHFSLAISGGSDEHGWPAGFPHLGSQPVDRMMLDALKGDRRP